MITPIQCSVNDVAHLLQFIALHGDFTEDQIYQTSKIRMRLVMRDKTKFDRNG